MKAILVLFLVCIASTYALETGPLNNLLQQIQDQIQSAIQQLVSTIFQIFPNQSKIDLSVIQGLFSGQLAQIAQQLFDKIKPILINLVNQLLNHSKAEVAQLEAEQAVTKALDELVGHLQNLLSNIISTIMGAITNSQRLDLAPILSSLIQTVIDKLKPQLLNIISQLVSSLANGKRGIWDTIENAFNLTGVWDTIQGLGSNLVGQFNTILSNLVFAGTQAWNNAKPIFAQLVSDLTNHIGDASTIVANAIAQLTQVIGGNGKRDILNTIVSNLGLGAVWNQIVEAGSGVVSQIVAVGTQLLFAGQQIWNNAKPILAQLVQDLKDHIGNGLPFIQQAIAQLTQVIGGNGKRDILDTIVSNLGLGAVWNQIVEAGSGVVAQIAAIGTQLLFAGQQIWNNAKPILQQLVSDLTNHIGDAVPLIQQAIAQLTQVVGKRDLVDFLLNNLGLGAVWDQIQQAGTSIVNQFLSVVSQVVFAGTQAWNNAKPILQQLIQDLKDHVGNAVPLITQAIAQLSQIAGKRDITDFLANTLGLSAVWSQIQQIGAGVVAQFVNIGTQLLFAGQQIWDNAKPIFSQLVSDLTNHVGDASTIITNALNSLNQVVGK